MLDALRRARHDLSRAELSTATGLSAQSITDIVCRPVERGLVHEREPVGSQGRGRPRRGRRIGTGRCQMALAPPPVGGWMRTTRSSVAPGAPPSRLTVPSHSRPSGARVTGPIRP